METEQRPCLAIPFGLIGAMGGWLCAESSLLSDLRSAFSESPWVFRILVIATTAALASAVGALLTRLHSPVGRLLAFPFATLLAGALNGALCVLYLLAQNLHRDDLGPPHLGRDSLGDLGVPLAYGTLVGAGSAVAFIPALAPSLLATLRAGRARAGTLVDGVDRRAVWRGCAFSFGAAAILSARVSSARAIALSVVGLPIVLLLLSMDIRALLGLTRAARALRPFEPVVDPEPRPQAEPQTMLDYGLGDDLVLLRGRSSDAYRDTDRIVAATRGSEKRARRALFAAVTFDAVMLLVSSGAALAAHRSWRPAPASVPAATETTSVPSCDARGVCTVYEDTSSSWDVALVGLDRADHHALLRLKTDDDARPVYDVVDYEDAQRLNRWSHEEETGTLLLRAADFAASSDDRKAVGVVLSPNGRSFLYGAPATHASDGDWAWIQDRKAPYRRRLDPHGRAQYQATFSPDGNFVAWAGYRSDVAGSDAGYFLFVDKTDGGALKGLGPVAPTMVAWGTEGRQLYALRHEYATPAHLRRSCLYEFDPQTPGTGTPLRCSSELGELKAILAPDGQNALVYGQRGMAGEQTVSYDLVPLKSEGHPEHWEVHRARGEPILSNGGLIVVDRQMGAVLVDLVNHREYPIEREHNGTPLAFTYAAWLDDGRVLSLLSRPLNPAQCTPTSCRTHFELVTVEMDTVRAEE